MSKQLQAKTTEKLHFAKLQLKLLNAVKQNPELNQINQLKALRQSVLSFVDAGWRAFLAEICLQANLPPADWNQIQFAEALALFDKADRASPELNQLHALLNESQSWLKALLDSAQQETAIVVAKAVDKAVDAARIPMVSAPAELDDAGLEQLLVKFEGLIMTLRDAMLEW